ncbi:MAG: hypothetical protein R2724_08250 [Bryobacterales bacterium]
MKDSERVRPDEREALVAAKAALLLVPLAKASEKGCAGAATRTKPSCGGHTAGALAGKGERLEKAAADHLALTARITRRIVKRQPALAASGERRTRGGPCFPRWVMSVELTTRKGRLASPVLLRTVENAGAC